MTSWLIAKLFLNKTNAWAKTMNTTTLPYIEHAGHIASPPGIKIREINDSQESQPKGAIALERQRLSRLPYKINGKSLRAQYGFTLQIGIVLSLLVLLALFTMPLQMKTSFENEIVMQEVVQLEEIVQTKQKFKAPPPPRPIVPIEVPNDEILEEEEFELDVALDLDEMIEDLSPPPLPDLETEPELDEGEVFMVVEEMPSMIGGREKLYEFVTYPVMAREANLEGMVVVGIVIEKDGSPTNIEVLKSVHPILDEAAMKAVSKVLFNPGKQRGKPVRVKMAIPIRFKLN